MRKNRCELIAGVSADHLEPKRKTVVLSDGRELPYDRLLVAAGSSPAVPPIKGLEAVENMTTFLSLDDALRAGGNADALLQGADSGGRPDRPEMR